LFIVGYGFFIQVKVITFAFVYRLEVGDFDDELMHLGCCMWVEINGVLKPLLAFVLSFQPCAVHNMLVIMLDLRFKNL
jgi:hypothetical protein